MEIPNQAAQEQVREWLLHVFNYQDEQGITKQCFPADTEIHSVLVVEGRQARWLYGGQLSSQARKNLIEGLSCWCTPPQKGWSCCNAVLPPTTCPLEAVIFVVSLSGDDWPTCYVAGRKEDLHLNKAAFEAAIAFLS